MDQGLPIFLLIEGNLNEVLRDTSKIPYTKPRQPSYGYKVLNDLTWKLSQGKDL